MTGLFDSHAHYEDALYGDTSRDILRGLPGKGIQYVLNCCSDMAVTDEVVRLANEFPFVYASVGVHPHWTPETPEGYIEKLRRLAKDPKVVAIGEIGLDYFFGDPKDLQMRIFTEQMDLARELDLPVIIHDRDAHEDCYTVLEAYKLPGVVHRFAGDLKGLERVLNVGMYVSFGGDHTFYKDDHIGMDVLRATPMDRLLLETDAPYAVPKGIAGNSDSGMLPIIAELVARIKGVDVQEVCDVTRENAKRVYRID